MFISDSHGFDEIMSNFSDQNAASINLYQQCFETRFLRDLEEFYRQHATYPSDTDSLLTYCQRVRISFANTIIALQAFY